MRISVCKGDVYNYTDKILTEIDLLCAIWTLRHDDNKLADRSKMEELAHKMLDNQNRGKISNGNQQIVNALSEWFPMGGTIIRSGSFAHGTNIYNLHLYTWVHLYFGVETCVNMEY